MSISKANIHKKRGKNKDVVRIPALLWPILASPSLPAGAKNLLIQCLEADLGRFSVPQAVNKQRLKKYLSQLRQQRVTRAQKPLFDQLYYEKGRVHFQFNPVLAGTLKSPRQYTSLDTAAFFALQGNRQKILYLELTKWQQTGLYYTTPAKLRRLLGVRHRAGKLFHNVLQPILAKIREKTPYKRLICSKKGQVVQVAFAEPTPRRGPIPQKPARYYTPAENNMYRILMDLGVRSYWVRVAIEHLGAGFLARKNLQLQRRKRTRRHIWDPAAYYHTAIPHWLKSAVNDRLAATKSSFQLSKKTAIL